MSDGGSMRYASDDEEDWTPPDSWLLADALDVVARKAGWTPHGRGTSADEVMVTYRRLPERPTPRPVEDVGSGGF